MIEIRTASAADAAELRAIYAPYVENTAVTFDLAVPSTADFEKKIASTLERYPFLAAEEGGRLVGYACASAFKSKAAYDWAVETTVYVADGDRGRGVGRALYARLEELLARQNVTNLNACITFPNPVSQAFHERLGYKTAAHFSRCGFKLGRWWDMIWMEKFISTHKTPPPRFVVFSEL